MTTIPGTIGRPFYENDLTVAGPVAGETVAALAGAIVYCSSPPGPVAAKLSDAPTGGVGIVVVGPVVNGVLAAPAGVVSCGWTVPGPSTAVVGLIPGLIGQPFYDSASLETAAALPGTIGIGVPGPVADEPAAGLVGTQIGR